MEKRIIAFDIGNRRVGVAVSDPFNSYAMPLETFFRGTCAKEDAASLARIAAEKDAGLIVCGLPLFADGTESEQTKRTRRFIDLLRGETEIPVVEADERYSTEQARGDLAMLGVSHKRDRQKKRIDSLAATYILENYLREKNKEETSMSMEEDKDYEESDDRIVELIDEDGVKKKYLHLMTFEYKGEWYIALGPVDANEIPDDLIELYHLVGGEDDEHIEIIEDDDLSDEVFEKFCELCDDELYLDDI